MAEFEILEDTKEEIEYPAQYAGKKPLHAAERRFVIGRDNGYGPEKIGVVFTNWNDEKQRAGSYIFIRDREGTFSEVFMTANELREVVKKINSVLENP